MSVKSGGMTLPVSRPTCMKLSAICRDVNGMEYQKFGTKNTGVGIVQSA